ncbi:hypothetical protein FOL01_0132 [Weissella jogaejeotgali]|uniref:Helix-turn-helix domain-containing protein n=1 Tax=Weissella jogaejeotgali TaxID=1631871 RepID=A0A1L6R8X7_9LACO|nr:hypothetical protein [Weissella jogaejeotgali]APS40991.1 hypothetical protein FOL01_0132 [Weissella jogaejeotgali]
MIRRERRKSNFSQIPNETLRDADLSNSAYRLLMYMLSMSDDWIFRNSKVAKDLGHNARWVSNNISELEKAGYITRNRVRNKRGQIIEWERILHESPHVAKGTSGKR